MRWILIGLAVLVVAATVFVLVHPSQSGNRAKLDRSFSAAEQHRIDTVSISRDELARATCAQGQHCWIAVNGVVYDLGDSPQWRTGEHHGVRAGADDTEQFVKSGHGVAVLQKLAVVGRYQP